MNIASKPVCYIGFVAIDWWYHNQAHSDVQLLTRLARDHRVLIVNSIGMRFPVPGKTSRPFYKIWRKIKSVARLLRRPNPALPNLYIYSPLPWPFYGSETARRFGAWFVRSQVLLAAWIANIHNPAIFTTTPIAWPVISKMKRRCLVYNRSDKHSMFNEADPEVLKHLEEELMSVADLCLYANSALMTEEQALTQGRAIHLDHGVDSTLFNYSPPQAIPEDLASIPQPIIGFFGNLRSYMVDFALLARIARDLPAASLVLVGDAQDSTIELEGIDNIYFVGKKDYSSIPAYGAHFDIALIPYRLNEWTRYCNPIKMKEYLALGLMIVSSDYPEAHNYADRIRIAADGDEMVKIIRECLARPIGPDDRQRFRASVVNETWDDRTLRLAAYVDELASV